LVADPRIREAFQQCALVGRQIDARHLGQQCGDLLTHERGEVVADHRVGHRVAAGGVAPDEVTEVAEGAVAGVEEAGLHQLVRGDVVDELHAHLVQRWPSVAEAVLDHPLPEGLGEHR
jgi:hypothetical protein